MVGLKLVEAQHGARRISMTCHSIPLSRKGQPRLVSRPQLEQVLEKQEKTAVKMVDWKERRLLEQ